MSTFINTRDVFPRTHSANLIPAADLYLTIPTVDEKIILSMPSGSQLPEPEASVSWWAFSLVLLGISGAVIALWLVQAFGFYQVFEAPVSSKKCCLQQDCCITLLPNSWIRMPRWMLHPYAKEVFLKGNARFDISPTHCPTQWFIQTPYQLEIQASNAAFSFFSDAHQTTVMVKRGQLWVYYYRNGKRQERRMLPEQVLHFKK